MVLITVNHFLFVADNVKLLTFVTVPDYLYDYKRKNRWRYISKNGIARFTYRQLYGIMTKTPIFRNIEQIHRTGFPTHFFCSSLKFWHRGKLVGVTFDDVGPKNQILASYFSAPCFKYDSFHNEEICPG